VCVGPASISRIFRSSSTKVIRSEIKPGSSRLMMKSDQGDAQPGFLARLQLGPPWRRSYSGRSVARYQLLFLTYFQRTPWWWKLEISACSLAHGTAILSSATACQPIGNTTLQSLFHHLLSLLQRYPRRPRRRVAEIISVVKKQPRTMCKSRGFPCCLAVTSMRLDTVQQFFRCLSSLVSTSLCFVCSWQEDRRKDVVV